MQKPRMGQRYQICAGRLNVENAQLRLAQAAMAIPTLAEIVGQRSATIPEIGEVINTDSLLYGTLHWDNGGHVQKGDTLLYTPSDFHVYAVEWDESSIRW